MSTCRRTCAPTSPLRARATPQFYARAKPTICSRSQRRRAGRGVGSPMRSASKSAQMVTPFFVSEPRKIANAFSICLDQRTQFGGHFPIDFWGPDLCPQKCSVFLPPPKMVQFLPPKMMPWFKNWGQILVDFRGHTSTYP